MGRIVVALAIGVPVGVAVAPQVASAATLTVTNCNDAGAGSLRAAVASASSGDTINFALSPSCSTITLTSGEIPIFQSLNIDGPGARALTVMSDPNGNFVQMENAANVAISGLSMQGGAHSVLVLDTSTGTVNVTNSAVLDAAFGIENGSTGTLNVANSTLSGNSEATQNDTGGELNVTNSTVSGNGNGILNLGSGTMNVVHSTVSGDSIGIANGGGGAVNVTGSIIAQSSPACGNPITDEGYNIDDDGSCGFNATGSISHSTTLDASLGILGDNGGPTQTMLPASTSPAVGVIPNPTTLNSVSVCPRTDQRGVSSFGKCTIGAVEGGFLITTTSLPNASPGTAFGPVTLTSQEARPSASPYVTTLKWKKVSLPKGIKLSKAGVLSGTPSTKLHAGTSSVKVQLTEKVTTLNGKKKVKTKTTVQATIPLTIT